MSGSELKKLFLTDPNNPVFNELEILNLLIRYELEQRKPSNRILDFYINKVDNLKVNNDKLKRMKQLKKNRNKRNELRQLIKTDTQDPVLTELKNLDALYNNLWHQTDNEADDKLVRKLIFQHEEKLARQEINYNIGKTLIAGITIVFCLVAADRATYAATGRGIFETIYNNVTKVLDSRFEKVTDISDEKDIFADLTWIPDGFTGMEPIINDGDIARMKRTIYTNDTGDMIMYMINVFKNEGGIEVEGEFEGSEIMNISKYEFHVGNNMGINTITWTDGMVGSSSSLTSETVDVEVLKEIIVNNFDK